MHAPCSQVDASVLSLPNVINKLLLPVNSERCKLVELMSALRPKVQEA